MITHLCLQHENLGMSMIARLTPVLAPAPDPAASAADALDTAAQLARTDHHILALHALAALLSADVSSALASRMRGSAALAAVLESLGSTTERRLLAPVQFQLQNFRLVEAHLLMLQVRACARAACWSFPCSPFPLLVIVWS